MTPHERFLSRRQRYQPIALPPDVSEDDLARNWTLSDADRAEIGKHSKQFRLSLAIQLCAVRVYGRFFTPIQDISPRITNYLGKPTRPSSRATRTRAAARSHRIGASPAHPALFGISQV
jgi:Domain of unknown function (DUF4158)